MPSGVAGFLGLDLWRAWYFPSVETRLWIRADHALPGAPGFSALDSSRAFTQLAHAGGRWPVNHPNKTKQNKTGITRTV